MVNRMMKNKHKQTLFTCVNGTYEGCIPTFVVSRVVDVEKPFHDNQPTQPTQDTLFYLSNKELALLFFTTTPKKFHSNRIKEKK